MHKLTLQTLGLFLIASVIGCSPKKTAEPNRPNIIFILTDDQRWDALGYAGNELIHTPEMDKLAAEGTYFENGLVTTPICAGSRATILTGLYERTHGYNFTSGPIQPGFMDTSYPKVLREAGYKTGFFGKFGVNYSDLASLFDEYDSYDRNGQFKDHRGYFYKTINGDTVHLTRYTGHQALQFIDEADPAIPFCLSLSFSAPHAHDPAELQYFWEPEVEHLLRDETIPSPDIADETYFERLPNPVKDGFNRLRWTWRYDTPEKYQHSMKGYYRMISGIDLELGKIRKKLEENGLAENTVIILMGDNGYFTGERQLAGKWLMYDNSIRVPLILFDPRNPAARRSAEMGANVDIAATVLDLAQVPIPASYQGKSLLPPAQGQSLDRDTVLIEHLWDFEHIPPSEGLRTAEWKYFRYVRDTTAEEMYNLADDPLEINNLAKLPEYKDQVLAFRQKLNNLIEAHSGGQ